MKERTPSFMDSLNVAAATNFITEAETISIRDLVNDVDADSTSGAYTVTLPPVSEAQGKVFTFYASDADATNKVKIQDQDDSIGWFDLYLSAIGDRLVIFSDGRQWHVIETRGIGIIPIPMPVISDAGVALAAFSDGDSATPGYCVTAEGLGIRWNDHGTPTPVGTKIVLPPDFDSAKDATLHILAAKTGNTLTDATKFTVQAFNNVVGALYDADADFGGDTDAMVGDATAKTVQHVTLTLATANLTAYPAAVELTIGPKDGTLDDDDVILLGHWIEYAKKPYIRG
jgi:hypothetical protein